MSGLSQEARALIDGVSDLDGPSPADKARIQQRLTLELGAAAFAASMVPMPTGGVVPGVQSAAAAHEGAWLGSLGKAFLALGALGGVTAALTLGGPETRPVATHKQLPVETAAAPAPTPAPANQAAAPSTGEDAIAAVPAIAQQARTRPSFARTPEGALQPDFARAPEGALQPGSARAPEGALQPGFARAPEGALQPGFARAPEGALRPGLAAKQAEPARPAIDSTAPGTLGQELALLGRAQAALRAGHAKQALALAQEHARRFPEGVMKQERIGVAALAECAVPGSERAQAKTFLQLAPQSPLAARVRKACELE